MSAIEPTSLAFRQSARTFACLCALFSLTMCHGRPDICRYPAARRPNDIERGSESLLRKLETTNGVMPPHYSCESKPVPASANIFISNINNTMQTAVFVDARGIGHGLTPDDCQDIAVSACEEGVDQFFSRQPFARPPAIHCKPAGEVHCD